MEIAAALGLIAFVAVALLLWRSYLPTYFQEKAKNLATKEDVRQITESVESVKSNFQKDHERLRHLLDRANQVSKFQFEKEYELYREMWTSLVELKRATLSLRPVMEWVDPNESREARKEKKLERFIEAYQKTADVAEKSRPFYSPTIWAELKKLLHTSHAEAVSYRHGKEDRDWEKYWKEAENAQQKVLELIEGVSDAMRTRLEEFKSAEHVG